MIIVKLKPNVIQESFLPFTEYSATKHCDGYFVVGTGGVSRFMPASDVEEVHYKYCK